MPDYNIVLSNSWGPEGSYSLVLEGLELNAFPCIAKIIGIPGGPGPPWLTIGNSSWPWTTQFPATDRSVKTFVKNPLGEIEIEW